MVCIYASMYKYTHVSCYFLLFVSIHHFDLVLVAVICCYLLRFGAICCDFLAFITISDKIRLP